MKTKDRLKEEIGLYKLLMTIASAMFSSLVSWLWSNAANLNLTSELAMCFVLVLFFAVILFLFFETNSKIQELDKYD
jgi:hypothetical protein